MLRDDWAAHLADKHLLMLKTVPNADLAKIALASVHLCTIFDCESWSATGRLNIELQIADARELYAGALVQPTFTTIPVPMSWILEML